MFVFAKGSLQSLNIPLKGSKQGLCHRSTRSMKRHKIHFTDDTIPRTPPCLKARLKTRCTKNGSPQSMLMSLMGNGRNRYSHQSQVTLQTAQMFEPMNMKQRVAKEGRSNLTTPRWFQRGTGRLTGHRSGATPTTKLRGQNIHPFLCCKIHRSTFTFFPKGTI